ncbi:hypothetical protein L211DRAFT_899709 [Terfezia boudieri ATCC MYA-4762]|uniref:PHD-type domain-containing protein n=1 Tax=Terfezia boudieri ATCC MYA-4762 TaxID=1051890 RepID=A0A3N4LU70_9PEZI|nr:hypothetical protein L211DRAFT_899709 [Terfezia boudieri ATCC MYA-4762]
MPKSTSGRPSRSASRKSTPLKNHIATTSTTATQAGQGTKSTDKQLSKGKARTKDLEEAHEIQPWAEPPLAEPRASYRDYDANAQPNVSTAFMQPLGTLPVAKNLAKYQGIKQKGAGKGTLNGNMKGIHNNSTTEPNGARSIELKTASATTKQEASTLTPPSPTVELRKFTFPDAPEEFPSTKTEVGRQRLSAVVQAAVDRSAQVGMEVLGKAIQALYEDSMQNPELGELLDAVLAQKATADQTVAFQAHIRTAREKLENQGANGASTPGSHSPNVPKVSIAVNYKKTVFPDPPKGRKGRRSSKRLQENHEAIPQLEHTEDFTNTHEHSFLGGPSEPPSPPSTATLNHDKARQAAKTTNETAAEMNARYERVQNELRKSLPSEIPVKESGIRFSQDLDEDSLVDAAAAGVGISTRGSVRKETPISRKRARSPDPPSTPLPAQNGTSPRILEPPEIGGPPKKKRQTRVKSSPMKVRTGPFVLAGNPTAESSSRGARNASECISENDDLCCVCNGPGKFLCCDRCPRSFHFTCINPPMDEDKVPEDSWYCNKCTTQMNPPGKQPRGLFGPLLDDVEKRNPLSFSLPPSIKNYFAGVESGPSGEYMASEKQDNKPTRRGGFVEELDLYRTKDKNGQPIFCFKCGTSALGQKKIIACDFCALYWHLDCVHPPLANPPSQTRKWMCPAHAEQGLLQPRRPRNAKVVNTCLRRGHKNNGYIEIENSESEDEMQFNEHELGGVIYRLPERGIKLDFIDKIKAYRENAQRILYDKPPEASKRRRLTISNGDSTVVVSREQSIVDEDTITEPSIAGKSPEEKDFAQTLLSLRKKGAVGLDAFPTGGDLSALINTLMAEAPSQVQELLRGTSSAPNPSSTVEPPPLSPAESTDSATTVSELEMKQLQALLELCQKRLSMLEAREKHLEVS